MVGGVAHSGRVIFAAAAVMVAVFFTFALSGPLPPKEMGVILGDRGAARRRARPAAARAGAAAPARPRAPGGCRAGAGPRPARRPLRPRLRSTRSTAPRDSIDVVEPWPAARRPVLLVDVREPARCAGSRPVAHIPLGSSTAPERAASAGRSPSSAARAPQRRRPQAAKAGWTPSTSGRLTLGAPASHRPEAHDLPPDHPRRPRLRLVPDRRRGRRRRGGRRSQARHRGVPRARPLHGRRIEHILETHNHADHVSGHGRLAAATGATIHIHRDAAPDYDHEPFDDGWELELGTRARARAAHARPPARAHRLRADRHRARPGAVGGADRRHAVRRRHRAPRPRRRQGGGRARHVPLAARQAAVAARRRARSGPATSAGRCAAAPAWT